MSTESHPSPTGSSSSSQYGGGGNSAGASENISQPSPAKPTWAQILNSTPNNSSATTNNPQTSSSSPSSQHIAAASKKNISPSTANLRPSNVNNPHEQQHQQQQQHSTASSQINNWPLNFNASSSTWMMDDETQRNSNSSQQSIDNDHNTNAGNTAEGFDRLESSSPTSEWNKPVLPNNSNANGWSNFGQQQHQQKNPSRSNPTNNQWTDMNTFYGTTTSTGNFSSHGNDPSNTWQDPSTSASDVLPSTSNNSVMSKHKGASSNASSISAVLKSNFSLTTTSAEIGRAHV